jgi:rRNA-processing protein EBP2
VPSRHSLLIVLIDLAERKGALDNAEADGEGFDIAVEDAIADRPAKRSKDGKSDKSRMPRTARDQKFGFGSGAGKRSKQNTKESTDDFDTGSSRGRGMSRGRGGSRGGRGGGRDGGGRGGSRGGSRSGGRGGSRGGGSRGGAKRLGKSRRVDQRS